MIQIDNKDSSFFTIDVLDLKSEDKKIDSIISDKVISFSVLEEYGKTTKGNLSIYDPHHVYSRIFRNGMRFNLTWGYKKWNKDPKELKVTVENPNEINGSGERKGLECVVQNPSGVGKVDGGVIYNVTFLSREFFTDRVVKMHENGTKGDIIRDVFNQLGMNLSKSIISFKQSKVRLGSRNSVRQEETNFKFLLRLAYEWRTIFKISYTPQGEMIGMFIDPDKLGGNKFVEFVTGGKGTHRTLEYKVGEGNIIDYSWKQHVGESGTGDSVRMTIVNGKTIFERFNAEDETVTTWTLVPERIKEALKKEDSFSNRFDLMKEWLANNDFDVLVKKGFFKPTQTSTAPQGFGYTINAKMIGDPLMTPPMAIRFGGGFPDRIRQTGKFKSQLRDPVNKQLTEFFLKKVNHNINRSGYLMDLEIADALTANGGAVR